MSPNSPPTTLNIPPAWQIYWVTHKQGEIISPSRVLIELRAKVSSFSKSSPTSSQAAAKFGFKTFWIWSDTVTSRSSNWKKSKGDFFSCRFTETILILERKDKERQQRFAKTALAGLVLIWGEVHNDSNHFWWWFVKLKNIYAKIFMRLNECRKRSKRFVS